MRNRPHDRHHQQQYGRRQHGGDDCRVSHEGVESNRAESDEARAAVAELIEAVRGIVCVTDDRYGYGTAGNALNNEKRNRLRAALAKVSP